MGNRIEEMMDFVRFVCYQENLGYRPFLNDFLNSLRTGTCGIAVGFLGFLVAGPVGAAAGASLGAVGAVATEKKFRPLWKSIRHWPREMKRQLVYEIEKVMHGINVEEGVTEANRDRLLAANRDRLVAAITEFCREEFELEVLVLEA